MHSGGRPWGHPSVTHHQPKTTTRAQEPPSVSTLPPPQVGPGSLDTFTGSGAGGDISHCHSLHGTFERQWKGEVRSRGLIWRPASKECCDLEGRWGPAEKPCRWQTSTSCRNLSQSRAQANKMCGNFARCQLRGGGGS